MITLSHSEMLARWRRALGLSTLRTDCSIEAVEGIDIDAVITDKMRKWYLDLLDSADPALLPVERITADFGRARRILEVKFSGWKRAAVPLTSSEAIPFLSRRSNARRCPTPEHPVAVLTPKGIHPYPEGNLEYIVGVIDPGPDVYILDESLLPDDPNLLPHP